MRFKVTFKDPDGPYEAIQDAAASQVKAIEGLDEDERESLIQSKADKLTAAARKWFRYGECVTIEIDTEAGTATVIPANP